MSEAHNIPTFIYNPGPCLLSRQTHIHDQHLSRPLANKNAYKLMWYRGGSVAQALFRHDRHISHNTVSLQSRLREKTSTNGQCHLKERFSPRIEIKIEKLALNVLAHIQSLQLAEREHHTQTMDTARIPNAVSVTRSALRCFLGIQRRTHFTTGSEQGLYRKPWCR